MQTEAREQSQRRDSRRGDLAEQYKPLACALPNTCAIRQTDLEIKVGFAAPQIP